MVGGDDYADAAVQPRDAGPAPARLVLQAVHPRRGAQRRASRPTRPGRRARSTSASPRRRRAAARSTSTSTTTRTPTRACSRCARRPRTRTTPSTPRSASRSGTKKIANLARRMGIRTPVSQEPRDDARRPARGRHPARHGARLPDARPARPLHVHDDEPRRGRPLQARPARARARRHQGDRPAATTASSSPSSCRAAQKAVAEARELAGAEDLGRRPGRLDPLHRRDAGHRRARAQIPGTFVAGKTGTTENYGDAWFVGWTDEITVAVWVGYPDELRPMETEFRGQPVAGGTYPANIWRTFVERALTYEEYGKEDEDEDDPTLAGHHRAGDAGRDRGVRPDRRPPCPTTTAPSGDGGDARRRPSRPRPSRRSPRARAAPSRHPRPRRPPSSRRRATAAAPPRRPAALRAGRPRARDGARARARRSATAARAPS